MDGQTAAKTTVESNTGDAQVVEKNEDLASITTKYIIDAGAKRLGNLKNLSEVTGFKGQQIYRWRSGKGGINLTNFFGLVKASGLNVAFLDPEQTKFMRHALAAFDAERLAAMNASFDQAKEAENKALDSGEGA